MGSLIGYLIVGGLVGGFAFAEITARKGDASNAVFIGVLWPLMLLVALGWGIHAGLSTLKKKVS